MRINVYTEELPVDVLPLAEIVTAEYISSRTDEKMTNYGLRVYLKSHPHLHYIPGRDDDRSAITFWCGCKASNVRDLIDLLKQTYETDNLSRFRDKAGQVEHTDDGLVGK